MGQRSTSEEIRRRVPRFIVNTIALVILYLLLYPFIPAYFNGINVPGLNIAGDQLARLVLILIILIFLARALPDALVLADVGVDILLARLGAKKEERPLRRAARDIIYIILLILLAAAVLPFFSSMPTELGNWLSTSTSLITLGLFLILIYDMGRTLYRVLEEKTQSLANWLAEQVNKERKDDA